MSMFNNAFETVNFQSEDPSQGPPQPGPDQLTAMLRSFVPQRTTYMPDAQANTKGGMDRVNANTENTGVTAYKGKGGQVTLTNEKITPTAAGGTLDDRPYTEEEFNRANPLTNGKVTTPVDIRNPEAAVKPEMGSGFTQKVDIPTNMFTTLSQLRAAKDIGTATSLFEAFQQSVTEQKTKLEQQAVTFADNKIGIPGLQRQLVEAEAADRAFPGYYIGIGDSKQTAALRAELNAARGQSLNEAKVFLSTNQTYNSLGVTARTAETEFKRIQTLSDRKELSVFNAEARSTEWSRQAAERADIRTEQKRDQLEQEAQGMSGVAAARIQQLNQGDFVGIEPGSMAAKVQALSIAKRNKDKNFLEAVNAQGTDLPVLALKGNAFAKELVLSEESAATGQSKEEIASMITKLQQKMQETTFSERVIRARYKNNPDQAKEALGQFQAMSGDITKKAEATTAKAMMAVENMQHIKTANYLNDVATWRSADPALTTAVLDAKRIPGTGANIDNVLTAYLGDLDGPDRAKRASEFLQLARIASDKHKDSMFGMPDYREASAIVAKRMADSGFMGRWLNKIKNTEVNGMVGDMLKPLGWMYAPSVMGKSKSTPMPVDPATGKPFGEE